MRVLLTRLSALGDIVHTWPLAVALGPAGARAEVGWVVEEAFLPLVASHPAVAVAIPVATRRWRRRPLSSATWREVRAAHAAVREFAPDVVLDPQGLVKSAYWGAASRAPERIGLARSRRREVLAGAFYTRTAAPPSEVRHVVDVNLSLAAAIGGATPLGAAPDGGFLLGERTPSGGQASGPVALLPATGGRGKEWGLERYAALARRLGDCGVPVTVAWGPGERSLAETVAAGGGERTELAPQTSIPALAALLARAAVVVGGDTGPVHLAASLGVATVAIFVATDPARNGPRGRRVAVVSGARGDAVRGGARTSAADDVPVDAVFRAVREELDGSASR